MSGSVAPLWSTASSSRPAVEVLPPEHLPPAADHHKGEPVRYCETRGKWCQRGECSAECFDDRPWGPDTADDIEHDEPGERAADEVNDAPPTSDGASDDRFRVRCSDQDSTPDDGATS